MTLVKMKNHGGDNDPFGDNDNNLGGENDNLVISFKFEILRYDCTQKCSVLVTRPGER